MPLRVEQDSIRDPHGHLTAGPQNKVSKKQPELLHCKRTQAKQKPPASSLPVSYSEFLAPYQS